MKNFSMTLDDYQRMLELQGHKCAICKQENKKIIMSNKTGRETLHIDHNHKTGKVRGLLCHNCNATIGLVKESKDTLYKIISYLDDKNADIENL